MFVYKGTEQAADIIQRVCKGRAEYGKVSVLISVQTAAS